MSLSFLSVLLINEKFDPLNTFFSLLFNFGWNVKTKDKIEHKQKSGIYKVQCNECDMFYIGQTTKSITTRFKQHISKFNNKHYEDSAIASHMYDSNHTISIDDLEVIEHVTDNRRLDCLESAMIEKSETSKLLNREPGPLNSLLLKYIV